MHNLYSYDGFSQVTRSEEFGEHHDVRSKRSAKITHATQAKACLDVVAHAQLRCHVGAFLAVDDTATAGQALPGETCPAGLTFLAHRKVAARLDCKCGNVLRCAIESLRDIIDKSAQDFFNISKSKVSVFLAL